MARVVTDVAGIDKEFDYLVPPALAGRVCAGTEVRVQLGPRRVGGWVLEVGDRPFDEQATLRPLSKRRGWGPEPEVVALAGWAAWRWAGKRATFLTAASAGRAVPDLPPARTRPPAPPPTGTAGVPPLRRGPGVQVVRMAPAADPTALVASAAQLGPALVVVPSVGRAAVLADRLRRAGGDVAVVPDGWAAARAGAAVVVGARSAAWAPCPGLSAVVVLDAHDEGLVQEGAPTWSAVGVAAERARRAGVPCLLVSACPTLDLLHLGPVTKPDPSVERSGWGRLEVVDRRLDDPRLGLYSEQLVRLVRSEARVACILNRTGRIRLLACGECRELVRCERCQAACSSPEPGLLGCPRCGTIRPLVCARCDSGRLKALRVGVARAREDLEQLAGRPVGELTGSAVAATDADVVVGTEAVLHRFGPGAGFTAVAFIDFDQELLAPRVRAHEEALSLLALGSRLVRGRAGRVVVQTRVPEHPVIRAAAIAEPSVAVEEPAQVELRRALRFPPFAAVATVSGPAAAGWVSALEGVDVLGPEGDRWMVKAPGSATLCDALAAVPRPPGSGLRVAVEPARL